MMRIRRPPKTMITAQPQIDGPLRLAEAGGYEEKRNKAKEKGVEAVYSVASEDFVVPLHHSWVGIFPLPENLALLLR